MKVLVLGGTRFIGAYTVRQLVEKGHDVVVFHRGQTSHEIPPEVTHIFGERKDLESFSKKFESLKPDVVLDMFPMTEHDANQAINTFKGITTRIVAISSADVYASFGRLIKFEEGEVVPTPSSEGSELRAKLYPYRSNFQPGETMYDYDKILVEKAFMENTHIPATILRLPMVYGPYDRQHRPFPYLKRMVDNRPYILLDEVFSQWKTCRGYVENVAHAIVLAITDERAANQIYNVAEETPFREVTWVNVIKNAYGKWKGEIKIIPSGRLQLDLVPEQHLDISSTKIREELGYKEIISQATALERTIQWELENPPESVDLRQFDYENEDQILQELINQ